MLPRESNYNAVLELGLKKHIRYGGACFHNDATTGPSQVCVVEVKASLAAARGDVFDISAAQMGMSQRRFSEQRVPGRAIRP